MAVIPCADLPLDVDKLPSPLAIPLAEYAAETDPLLRLWSLCDVTELTLRILAALGISDWRRAGKGDLPEVLRADVGSRIEQPTLGKWRGLVLALARKAPPGTPMPGYYPFVIDRLDPVLRGEGERPTLETSVLELRNRLAHGGGMSRAVAARLLAIHGPRFEAAIDGLDWLAGLSFVAENRGALVELRGRRPAPSGPSGVSSVYGRVRDVAGASDGGVVAVAGETALPLWPLVCYGVPGSAQIAPSASPPAPLIYARRGEVRVLLTPIGSDEAALAEIGGAAVAAVDGMIRRPAAKEEVWEVPGFEKELDRDAAHLVGRETELATIRAAAAAPRGLAWVTGPAGIGKSFLMARAASDLVAEAGAGAVVLAYRFRIGDGRCSRDAFLRFAVERLRKLTGTEPPPGRRPPQRELEELLDGPARDRRVLFIVDGLDEIAAADPGFAAQVPLALAGKARWIVAGRPDRGLPQLMQPPAAEPLFPAGVPPLQAADARAMMLAKIGPLSKKLLAQERDRGEAAVNPFVDRVVERAAGLPIYVSYVIGDVLAGRLRDLDEHAPLPPSLEAYHAELLRGSAVGSLHQALSPMIATLALAREPMAADELAWLLARRTAITADARGLEVVGRALAAAATLLRRAAGSAHADPAAGAAEPDRYALFHLSLREHLVGAAEPAVAIATARAALADAAADPGTAAGSPAELYLLRHGVAHLLDAGRAPEAAGLLTAFPWLMRRVTLEGAAALTAILADAAAARGVLADAALMERLRAVESFLGRAAHLIARGGSAALLQAAISEGERSPITAAAESFVAAGRAPGAWLRRLDRPEEPVPSACLRTLEGHAAVVTDVALHPDGRRALTTSGDASLRLWDLHTGEQLRALRERGDTLSFAMVTTMPQGEHLRPIAGAGWTIWSVALLGDGRRAAAAHGDRTIKIWELDSGAHLGQLSGHQAYVWSVAALPDGRRLLSASDDGSVRLWDADAGTQLAVLSGHRGWVACAVPTPDGAGALSGGGDGTLRLWSLPDAAGQGRAAERRVLAGHKDYVAGVAVAPDGRTAYSASGDGTIGRWDLGDGRCLQRWEAHRGGAWTVACAPDGKTLLTGGRDGVVHLWDAATGERLRSLRGHAGWVWRVAFAGPGRAVSAAADRTVKLWDLDAAAATRGRASHDGPIAEVAMLGEDRAVTAGADGLLKLWELRTGRSLRSLRGHAGEVRGVAAAGSGLVSVAADGLRRWTVDGAEAGPVIPLDVDPVAVRADRERAWVLGRDGALLAVDLAAGTATRLASTAAGALCLAVDAARGRALVGGADTAVRIVDLARGAEVRALRGHSWDVQAVAFHPDGRRALSAGRDRAVKIWDLASGRCLATLARHSGNGGLLAPWGELVLSCTDDRTLELWRADDRVVARWPADAAFTSVAIAPDNRVVLGDVAGQVTWLELVGATPD